MFRLVPGHLLYPVAPGDWRCVSPQLDFLRISGPEDALQAVHASLVGSRQDAMPLDGDAATLLGMLVERGAVYRAEAEAPADGSEHEDEVKDLPQTAGKIGILGSGPVAEALVRMLGDGCIVIPGPLDEGAASIVSALVVCSLQTKDAEWTAIDELCQRTGTSWHRAFAEGGSLIVGPFSAGGRTVSYHDYRARRRAAAATVEELDRLWNYLDSNETGWNVWPDDGLSAVAAGLIAHDLICHAKGLDIPGGRCETEIDLGAGTITRHTVLPLPSGISL
ncbi:hypothetical protein AB0323_06255 [Arthrobacter sp. NPDC080031]|uniref:hypothetical protein n=1 Tax=Arthrobacter sp. NPDC080031 TaxID=3155918 RepID=UPI00344CD978